MHRFKTPRLPQKQRTSSGSGVIAPLSFRHQQARDTLKRLERERERERAK